MRQVFRLLIQATSQNSVDICEVLCVRFIRTESNIASFLDSLLRRVKMETELNERKISIRGVYINYLQVGCGEHPVLLIPGGLGTIWSSFRPQIENLDRTRFTIVAWDPPGYGKSRPPNRTFPEDYQQRDASFAKDLMAALGFKTFSIIGWSNGGITACVLAAAWPNSVRKMIILSSHSFITTEEINRSKGARELGNPSEKFLKETIAIHGYDYSKSVWNAVIDVLTDICEKKNGEICTNILGQIQCPTLIVHGDEDSVINPSHAIFLRDNIKGSRMRIIEGGCHYLNLNHYEEFNKLATEFLSPSIKISKL